MYVGCRGVVDHMPYIHIAIPWSAHVINDSGVSVYTRPALVTTLASPRAAISTTTHTGSDAMHTCALSANSTNML